MLGLHDHRWHRLTTFFGEAHALPALISAWLRALGTDQERVLYYHELFATFLHQATITNAAFALVPWLMHVCEQHRTNLQVEYLTDIALVEANRLSHGVYFNREGTEPYPDWLMDAYQHALASARDLVDTVIEAEPDGERKRGLIALRPALYGNAELAWSQW